MAVLTKNKREVRKAFTNFLLGNINATEARSLGVDVNNGRAAVPKTIAEEIKGFLEQENLLRKYGKVVTAEGNLSYPVLTGDTNINVGVHSSERSTNEITLNHLGLTAELLKPVEFDSVSVIKKKLLLTTPVSVSDLIVEAMEKAYLQKEMDYMINGTSGEALDDGSLLNKAKNFTPEATEPIDIIKELKNHPSTRVTNKARWIVNKAAVKYVEDLVLTNGEAALKTIDHEDGGVKYMLLGFPLDYTDEVKGSTDTAVVFYFGDFSSFTIQDNSDGLEVETLYEKYAEFNEVGFRLYNLLDGKLVYSELEPTVYRLEI